MFTPPPSPAPPGLSETAFNSYSPPLSLSTSGNDSGSLFLPIASSSKSPMSPSLGHGGRVHTSLEAKKQIARRMLWLVVLVPVAMVLYTSWCQILRHLMPTQPPSVQQFILDKRDAAQDSSQSGSQTPTSVTTAAPSSSGVPTVPTAPVFPTPFPQPFETLPANFSTVGCQAFFVNFTQDENFRQCRAFSFLLNASAEFLTAQRNATLINDIIYGTCNTRPTLETCDARMSAYLSQLETACATEIGNKNPVVLQAQVGFQSYTPMRQVACQENAVTGRYCYIEAVTAMPPSDIFFYALPLGTGIPKNVVPTCSPCVKSLLAIFSLYVDTMGGTGSGVIAPSTGNSTAPSITPQSLPVLSKTYPAAARLAVQECGGTFATVGITSSDNGGGQPRNRISSLTSLGALLFAFFVL